MANCTFPRSAQQGGGAPLAGENLAKAKESLAEAIRRVDRAIYSEMNAQLPTTWERFKAWQEANISVIGQLADIGSLQRRLDQSLTDERVTWEAQKKQLLWPAVNAGTIGEGAAAHTINEAEYRYLICTMQARVGRLDVLVQLFDQWSKGSVGANAIRAVLSGVGDFLANLGKITFKVVETGAAAANWLPWIVGALVLGPFLLKSFAAYKRGGAGAAAEAAAGELEAGRAAVGRGARAAWEGGKSLAKRAASGGVLKGAPKRHRKRRPARA